MVKIIDNYTMTTYLGKGEYGRVYRGFHIDTRIEVAIKMIELEKFEATAKLAELTKNELETLRLLSDNINVVNFVEMIKSSHYVYLIYEFCEGGTLEDLLRDRGPLPEK
jgi:serine/threonine-protein kinase ULK2